MTHQCSFCTYECKTVSSLKKHTDAKHYYIKYPCFFCDFTCTQNARLLQHHRKMHAPPSSLACPMCGYVCYTEKSLQKHVNNHEIFKCTLCPKFQSIYTKNI